MKKPRYTDTAKYPNGYRKAVDTDITVSWRKAREKMEQERKERELNRLELQTKLTALRKA